MLRCVLKSEMVPSFLQVNEMNDKMSFQVDVKFAAPFYMGRISEMLYGKNTKVLRPNYNQGEDRPN